MARIASERDLAYWLQGYFEIARTTDLSADQALGILRAANGIEKDRRGPLTAFILDTLLTQPDLRAAGRALSARLNDTFLHEIDPTIPGDQEQQRRLHRGDDKPAPGIVPMC